MPYTEKVGILISLNDGRVGNLGQSLTIDEYVLHDLTLTSNQSAVSVNFGGVATGLSFWVSNDQGITLSMNNITLPLNTNGCFFVFRTSLTTMTLTNDQANAVAQVRIGILGT